MNDENDPGDKNGENNSSPDPITTTIGKGLRDILILVRDFGMPITMFGTGIYLFLFVVTVSRDLAIEYKALIAVFLTLFGLITWLWVYVREHPRAASDDVRDQLNRMTELIDLFVRKKLDLNGRD